MVLEHIRKRDGRVVPFRKGKITKAIFKAAYKVSDLDIEVSDNLVAEVIEKLYETDKDISETEGLNSLIGEVIELADTYDVGEVAASSIENLIEMLLIADGLADEVEDRLEELDIDIPDVETIQNIVEKTLIEMTR